MIHEKNTLLIHAEKSCPKFSAETGSISILYYSSGSAEKQGNFISQNTQDFKDKTTQDGRKTEAVLDLNQNMEYIDQKNKRYHRMKKPLNRLLTRETILYLIFGVLTTLVNFVVFDRMNAALGEDLAVVSQIAAFAAAVLFAFFTNKPFVFQSRDWSAKTLVRELPAFFGGRILSFLIETALVLAARDLFHAGHYVLCIGQLRINGLSAAKAPISVITVILNYIFSKLFVFRKKS
jgi:putative flippase GtrA